MITPPRLLNEAEQEWASPPAFESAKEGLAHLDAVEAVGIAALEAEARARMAQDSEDPTAQSYFMRVDRKTVVRDDKEYVACQLHGIRMKIIPYSHALQLLKEEDARKRTSNKAKKAKKAARKARKRNR